MFLVTAAGIGEVWSALRRLEGGRQLPSDAEVIARDEAIKCLRRALAMSGLTEQQGDGEQ